MAGEFSRQNFLRAAAGALAAGTVFGTVRATAAPNPSGWDGLSTAIGGKVLLPGDPQFAGAKQVFVMMEHVDKKGAPKIVTECTYPLTGTRVVDRIYTDLAIIDVPGDGRLIVRAMVEGLTLSDLQAMTAAPLTGVDACAKIAA